MRNKICQTGTGWKERERRISRRSEFGHILERKRGVERKAIGVWTDFGTRETGGFRGHDRVNNLRDIEGPERNIYFFLTR